MPDDVKTLEKVIDLTISVIDENIRGGNYEAVRTLSETLVNLKLAHKHAWDSIYVSYKVLDFQTAMKQAEAYFKKHDLPPADDLPFGKAV